ncbi:stress-induced-phosphoprotein, putative [Entamoeba invadens IP1]|uniref:stress-induced-phosphoprotein, putative n=1 Tax=Entamoeba invadens IP1 TaxID=370355 RepID=UPI0002C3F3E0|nr:stress-induced-phosphoprotein, putative [Entamoeba invadens IP1]ELP93943.1 stress-induced-phosphoprotein, putative [Entamoeba invadens IP1]|eukprot:XP_004260714.1 stress-induced-phosphoprotein, putative [Entamoeba invadens IP1]
MSLSPQELAEQAKARGTQFFKDQKFAEAITEYTEALKYDSSNGVLYSNRSACYASLNEFEKALEDANNAIKYKPGWARGYSRKAFALVKLEKYDEAEKVCEEGLKIEPDNEALKTTQSEIFKMNASKKITEMWVNWKAKLAANPKTAAYVQDQTFCEKMERLSKNPNELQNEMGDPRVTEALMALMGIDTSNFEQHEPTNKMEEEPKKAEEPKKEEPKKEEVKMEEEETPEAKAKKEALVEKQKGNEFYKNKKFQEALDCYSKALELDPKELTYKLNKTAAYLEMENYEQCIKECLELLDEYKEQKVYTQSAKLYMRIGNAFYKQSKFTEALEYYKKSCTEKRTEEILNKIKATEKQKEQKEAAEYFSVEKGEEARAKGSQFFKEQNFPEAIKCYTDAIKRNPNDHLAYSNRCASYQKLGEHPSAVKDAEMCIKIKPDFIKGYNRKAFSHYCMKEYHKAMSEYENALKIDPNNAEALSGVQTVQGAVMGNDSKMSDEERMSRAMADPEIRNILNDPLMRKVLDDFQNNPAAAQDHLKDPEIMKRLQKLMEAGILKMR